MLFRSVVHNLFHPVAPDQDIISSMALLSLSSFQILLWLIMNSVMVPIAIGHEHYMEKFWFIDTREMIICKYYEAKSSLFLL